MREAEGTAAWLDILDQCSSHRIQLGLDRIKEVGERAGLFTFSCPIITVGGTNGKGSTVAALAKLLQSAGKKVGSYTSPHLLRINERIQINGRCVSDAALGAAITKIEQLRANTPLSFFELTTLAAFDIFQQAAIDVLVLEVGLGGRLDAVNAVDPTMAIITSISFDHQEYLGDTLDSIAKEKAGIFRTGIPVIISEKALIPALLTQAEALRAIIYRQGDHFSLSPTGKWRCNNEEIELSNYLLPKNSVSLALAAYTILRERGLLALPPLLEVASELAGVEMVGRFYQLRQVKSKLILDVGHNPEASTWLAQQVRGLALKGKIHAVWASLADKDLAGIVSPLKEIVTTWYVGELDGERAVSCQKLEEALHKQGIKDVRSFASIPLAFAEAQHAAGEDDCVVVFGSFYTVGAILQQIRPQSSIENYGLKLDQLPQIERV